MPIERVAVYSCSFDKTF